VRGGTLNYPALRRLGWRLGQWPGLLLWAAFLAWETLAIRALTLPSPTWVGWADALCLAAAGMALGTAAFALRNPWRALVLLAVGGVMAGFNLANGVFFGFFDTFLSSGSASATSQVPGAMVSIRALLTARMVVVDAVVPAALLIGALALARGRARRTPTAALVSWLAAFVILAGARTAGAHRTFVAAECDPLLNVLREEAGAMYRRHAQDPKVRIAQLAKTLPAALGPVDPAKFRSGTLPRFPLYRAPVHPGGPTQKLNVVIVLMESFRVAETGIGTGHADVAPRLDALAQQGLFVPHFYANGHQTVRGEFATLCSMLPDYGSGQVYSTYPSLATECLPEILADHGYQTHWFSAYDANFGHKRDFLSAHGVEHIHDRSALQGRKLEHPPIGWGAADMDTAGFVADTLDKAKPPFFAEWMTLSDHHPFTWNYDVPHPGWIDQLPERQEYKSYLQGLHYTDAAVGHFIDLARTRPWFKDTVFVFLGDHGAWLFPEHGARALTPAQQIDTYFRIPFIVWSPGHVAPRRITAIGSQIDASPTLLDLLGLTAPNAMEGVSLLSEPPGPPRFAIFGSENAWNIRQGDQYCYALGKSCFKSMAPYCPTGYDAQPAGHVCFRYDGDLFKTSDAAPAPALMSDVQGAGLLERAQKIVRGNHDLITFDQIFPRPQAH